MWKIAMRGKRGTPFEELGSFARLGDVARKILEIENVPDGAIFFRVHVDPMFDADDDAAALSHLDYQTARHYYSLTRSQH